MNQVFTSTEVAQLSGVPLPNVDYWQRTRFLAPSVRRPRGRGSAGVYNFADVCAAWICRELREHGVELKALKPLVEYVQRRPNLETVPPGTVLLMKMGPEGTSIEEHAPALMVPGILWTGPPDGDPRKADPEQFGFSLIMDLEVVVKAVQREVARFEQEIADRKADRLDAESANR